ERAVIPKFLLRQRWFGAKSRTLETVSIRDWVPATSGPSPTLLVFIRAYYSDGQSDRYCLPLGIAEGVPAEALLLNQPAAVLAHPSAKDTAGVLFDAVADDRFCEWLLRQVAEPGQLKTRAGSIAGQKTSAFDSIEGEPLPIRRGSAEQSNSTIYFGSRFLM